MMKGVTQTCQLGAKKLTATQIEHNFAALDAWTLTNNDQALEKIYKFADYASALDFTIKIGHLAEQENHHPDIHLSWAKVGVILTTHDCGGLSLNDFILASKIDAIALT